MSSSLLRSLCERVDRPMCIVTFVSSTDDPNSSSVSNVWRSWRVDSALAVSVGIDSVSSAEDDCGRGPRGLIMVSACYYDCDAW